MKRLCRPNGVRAENPSRKANASFPKPMISRLRLLMVSGLLGLSSVMPAAGEAMLQYFNTSWAEITRKMPELAEAG